MPSWKKVVTSGSQAELAAVTASIALQVGTNQQITSTQSTTFLSGSFTGSFTGALTGTASWASNAANSISASRASTAEFSDKSYAVRTIPVSQDRTFTVAYLNNGSAIDFQDIYTTSSFTYNPVSQSLSVTASRAVSASWAGVASSSIVTHNDSNVSNFLIFTRNSGSTGLLTNTASNGIRYNPASNSLSSYTNDYTVKHQGSINFTLTAANSTFYPAFTNNLGGDNSIYVDQIGSYNYTPGTQTLAAGNFSGSRVIATSVTASFVSASSLISNTLTVTNISASAVTASATLIGTASAQAFTTTIQQSNIAAGSTIIYSLPTASYEAMFFKYAMRSGSSTSTWVQTGEIYTMRSGVSDTVGTQTSTTTAPFNILLNRLSVTILNGNFTISGSFTSGSWAVRGIVQVI